MDKRFKKISELLSEYSRGHFERAMALSEKLDEIDAIIAGINMLGEELKAATISKNYFNNIFNSVSDMVFILDSNGKICDMNHPVALHLGYHKNDLIGKPVNFLQAPDKKSFNKKFLLSVKSAGREIESETYFITPFKNRIAVRATFSVFKDKVKTPAQILLTAKDINSQIQNENAVIRAIVDTQETERKRLAKDLHDSLGQRMSAVKFYISTIAEELSGEEQKLNLLKSKQALQQMMVEMRNICFNLLPATLADFGLIATVRELCHQPEYEGKIQFKILADPLFPALPKEMEMDIFRMTQEFITNAIVHGSASMISLRFSLISNGISLILKDNGKGFDVSKINSSGRGIRNVRSRIKSHSGEILITSIIGKGTTFKIDIPRNNERYG